MCRDFGVRYRRCDESTPAHARRFATDSLRSELSGTSAEPAMQAALLVVSELVTNAIRHAEPLVGGQVTVTWTVDGRAVLIRVTDGGAASRPRVRHPSPRETSGRGLALVEALATHWGVEDAAGATTVWATIGG